MRYSELYEFEKQDISPILEEISSKCSDIISILKKHPNVFLFRGVNNKEAVFHAVPRNDRKSLSTPQFISDMVDDWFAQYGFAANRKNSLFTSASWEQAETYGKVYMIFPENGFDYTWFESSADFWSELLSIKEIKTLISHPFTRMKRQNEIDPSDAKRLEIDVDELRKDVEWMIMRSKPKKTDLEEALAMGHEVMIANRPYYAINQVYMPDINKWLKGLP